MPEIRAALFDLDGTLQDSEVLWVKATRDYVRDLGIPFSDEDAFAVVYGRSWRSIYDDILARKPSLTGSSMEKMAIEVRDYFLRLRSVSDIAIPGSVNLARQFAKDGVKVAVVSGSVREDVRNGVETLGISDILEFIIGAEDYGEGKPDPECYLKGSERIGVPPAECIVFEDSAVGVLSARRAGMYVVGLARPDRPKQDLSPADLILPDLSEFSMDKLPAQPGEHC